MAEKKNRGMGRGLAAILSVSERPEVREEELRAIPLDLIAPSPSQPRKAFDEESLEALVDSYKTVEHLGTFGHRRIAYLGASSPAVFDPRQIEGFKQGLRENGLIEGRNVTVDYFWAEGDRARLEQLAGEIGKRGFDVIVTAGPQAVHGVLREQETSQVPLSTVSSKS